MYPSISEIQSLIKRQRIDKALNLLISLSEHGDEKVYRQVQALVNKYKRLRQKGRNPEDIRAFQNQFRSFLSRLERNHTHMMRFITSLDKGGEAFKKQAWVEAREHFEKAEKLRGSRFRMKAEALQRRIEMCQQGEALEQLILDGDDAYNVSDWKRAKERYTSALELWGKEFKYKKSDFERLIAKCDQALDFEAIVEKAQEAREKEQWSLAMSGFKEALEKHHEDFEPGQEILQKSLDECVEQAKIERRVLAMQFTENKKRTSPVVWFVLFIALFLSLTGIVIYQAVKENAPVEPRFPVIVANPHSGISPIKPDNVASPGIIAPNPEENENPLPEEENPSVQVSNPQESDPGDLNPIPPRDSKKDTPGKNKDSLNAASDTSSVSQEESSLPLRVAILPFCLPSQDSADIFKNLYLDASFALSSMRKDRVAPVSKNAVKGAIYRLSMADATFCEGDNAMEVAQSLDVHQILITHINTLPDEEIQVNCEILDISLGQYTKSFTLSDHNIQRLRASLKSEIQKLFL